MLQINNSYFFDSFILSNFFLILFFIFIKILFNNLVISFLFEEPFLFIVLRDFILLFFEELCLKNLYLFY